ncbi:MAG: 2-C-methyl-D-erythritol 2,4-cyclodiphosphate synthase, partial [Planctomycetes bacterium]|nr:2-C-methyl-D-erythritol 2,4-cyclodiphosphate synthase [Planctomycetota bacterium]
MTAPSSRVGIGTDLHRLVEGRSLWIGGVEIPSDRGALGHSDGDVALHAVTDALLGATALGDIGELFPDDDPAHAGAPSSRFLVEAARRVREAG